MTTQQITFVLLSRTPSNQGPARVVSAFTTAEAGWEYGQWLKARGHTAIKVEAWDVFDPRMINMTRQEAKFWLRTHHNAAAYRAA